MNLKKIFSFVLFFLLFFVFISTKPIYGTNDFSTSYTTSYRINNDVESIVSHTITLRNLKPNVYATSYHYQIGSTRIANVKAYNNQGQLALQLNKSANVTSIDVYFPDKVVGLDKSQVFNISYKSLDFATLNGQLLNISIPQIITGEGINHESTSLLVPIGYGQPSLLTPQAGRQYQADGLNVFVFSDKPSLNKSVVAVFGNTQIFEYDIRYQLINTHPYPINTEIALIPDTNNQKVSYQLIDPLPIRINRDQDGNYLATYHLDINQELDISTKGKVKTFYQLNTNPIFNQNLKEYVQKNKKWSYDSPIIASISAGLNNTYDIYRYVVDKLDYDYNRVIDSPDRKGAIWALLNPQKAVCMEFTDVFIALARAKKIPAREINGYAYTNNPALRPLSFDLDILHAWPQYFDQKEKVWMDIDPTWEDTTGGIDYFHYRDLNRIAFVIHGIDSLYPPPAGSYALDGKKQKNINISFADSFNGIKKHKINDISDLNLLSGVKQKLNISIANSGNTALFQETFHIKSSEPVLQSSDRVSLDFIGPFMTEKLILKLKSESMWKANASIISITSQYQTKKFNINFMPLPRYIIYQISNKISGFYKRYL